MRELWIATGNEKKRQELDRLLRPLGFALRLQSEAPEKIQVEEDQPDFLGNAQKKARTLALAVGGMAVGDDSGLSVDALDGRPGVHSARYAGPGKSDLDRIHKLLDELSAVPTAQRTAHFTCAICLCDGNGEILAAFEETCPGLILDKPRGDKGFGYDPVFVAQPFLDQQDPPSFAQLDAAQKDTISHRGLALRRLVQYLETTKHRD